MLGVLHVLSGKRTFQMCPSLSPDLMHAIKQRIQDPRRRSVVPKGEPVGVVDDPHQLGEIFDAEGPSSSVAWRVIAEQMKAWGQTMPPMHLTRHADGSLQASSEDIHNYPLAPPATETEFRRLEKKVGRPIPNDVRQLYSIADGGFGPGAGYTSGFGTGLYSLKGIGQVYDDLCRRGPDYTGTTTWPRHLLPLTDETGAVSYDLERGAIVAFNEYWQEDGITIDEAFIDIHPSLESWLGAWLEST